MRRVKQVVTVNKTHQADPTINLRGNTTKYHNVPPRAPSTHPHPSQEDRKFAPRNHHTISRLGGVQGQLLGQTPQRLGARGVGRTWFRPPSRFPVSRNAPGSTGFNNVVGRVEAERAALQALKLKGIVSVQMFIVTGTPGIGLFPSPIVT